MAAASQLVPIPEGARIGSAQGPPAGSPEARQLMIPAGAQQVRDPAAQNPALTPAERRAAIFANDPAAAAQSRRIAAIRTSPDARQETFSQLAGLHGPLGDVENALQGAGRQFINMGRGIANMGALGQYSLNPIVAGAGNLSANAARVMAPYATALKGPGETAGRIGADVMAAIEGGGADEVGIPIMLKPSTWPMAAVGGGTGFGTSTALHAIGLPPALAGLGGMLAGGAAGLLPNVLLAPEAEAGAELGPRAQRGVERLLSAIKPGAGAPEMRQEVTAAVPDIRALLGPNPMRGVETKLVTRRAGETLADAAHDIWEREHAPLLARHADVPVVLDPVADRIEALATPGLEREFPAATRQILQRADEYRGRVEPLRTVESRRAARRRYERDPSFAARPTTKKDLSRAITSGLVDRIEDTLQAAGAPGVREINMRTGRLGRIGEALTKRANAAEQEAGRGDRIMREAHLFGAGHGLSGAPYVGAFIRPIGMLRAAFTPQSTNDLVAAGLSDIGGGERESLGARLLRGLTPKRPQNTGGLPAVRPLEPRPPEPYQAGPSSLRTPLQLRSAAPLQRGLPPINPRPGGVIPAGPVTPPEAEAFAPGRTGFTITGPGRTETAAPFVRPLRGLLEAQNPEAPNIELPRGVITESPVKLSNVMVPWADRAVRTEEELRRLATGHTLPIQGDVLRPSRSKSLRDFIRGPLASKRPGPGASLPGDVHIFTPEETSLRQALEDALRAIPERGSRRDIHLPPNASGESKGSLEALNRARNMKLRGEHIVSVDTRSGIERPLIGVTAPNDAEHPSPYEVTYRVGPNGREQIAAGAKARMLPPSRR